MHTKIYQNLEIESHELSEAAEILKRGGIVAFPTETVYGLAARADSETASKLSELKSRKEGKYYSLHIPFPEALSSYVPDIDLKSKKIVDNFWPGPLTMVFNVSPEKMSRKHRKLAEKWDSIYHNQTVGIRCPDEETAARFLYLAGVPVVATSANISGKEPAVTGEEVIKQFDGKIDAVIDGGVCSEALNSTVAMISQNKLMVLREGAVKEQELLDISAIKLLFVCEANTLSSPIAAELCRKRLAENFECSVSQLEEKGYNISCAGVKIEIDKPAHQAAMEFAKSIGGNLDGHITTGLSEKDIIESDAIFVMAEKQRDRILEFYPQVRDKCYLLRKGKNIIEPDGKDENFQEFVELLEDSVNKRLGEIVL
ncbi:t(6)A37 threonylcarbamoyladenosine biosynthesis protein RimN [Sedimentisphaera cyanobacteriorum]|uniref:L-threonylcarbamoyladenylate synthase n=1 Tax=Sedimentisphaera cyanobacteriorum TaxID=1940790 RepID=A0A1Q2HNA6_9BACT|nr:L-threonylcarbamoyladenylate synthase [Sedimentisphaera cyanobacteriorum]AQQ08801.1 t(6)A37 threonylcarbamoyladenosine biosynthesis protein RimN [Sedimentisphaera cyanobacteriorum]